MDTPKVSVITPTFNAKDRIRDLVINVARQSYPNIEHLVINDGSDDGTGVILEALAPLSPNVRIISQSNQGRSNARNRGIADSRGEYILFLDDDDSLDVDAIKQMVRTARNHPDSVIYTAWKVQPASGMEHYATGKLLNQSVFETTAIYCPFVIHGCLSPRNVIIEANGFDDTLDFAEDWDLWQRLGRAGIPFVRLQESLVTYNLPQRELTSETAFQQYQQAAQVIKRGFIPDSRVKQSLSQYKNGLPARCPEEGLVTILAWFAGIEYSQNSHFQWLSESIKEIRQNTDYVPSSDTLAFGFSTGFGYGRGSGSLNSANPEFARLSELAATFELEDPSQLVPRLVIPDSLPVTISEIQHCEAGLLSKALPTNNIVGRVQPWVRRKNLLRPLQPALYVAESSSIQLKFSLPRGAVLACLHAARNKKNLRALPGRLTAMARSRHLIGRTLRETRASIIDHAVIGSILPNMKQKQQESFTSSPRPVFDQIFTSEDPWGYDRPYEVRKYNETLELLSDLTSEDVVTEMACAEGHFTVRLAPIVYSVHAYDISTIALERLSNRLKHLQISNVEIAQHNLLTNELDEPTDVIVCSEVLYYLPPDRLDEVISRLIAGLKDGGCLVHAHAFEASQRGTKPGFGWRQPYGAQRISDAFARNPKLQRRKVIETDLYLVERYEKTSVSIITEHEFRPIDREHLEPAISNQVLWTGYKTTPQQAARLCTSELPVLMYHSINTNAPSALLPYQVTPSDFKEQLSWLRENGYRTPSLSEVSALVRLGRPISGKAIVITFDDAYQCFAETAWPLLKDHGFGAVMFAAPDFLGDAARWDAKYGQPMKIMERKTLADLADDGLIVGSHSKSHRPMTHLTTKTAMEEMLQSKDELQALIEKEVNLFAFPYGVVDQPLARLAKYCGYSLAFSTNESTVNPFDNPHTLGRLNVDGTKDPLTTLHQLPANIRKSILMRSKSRIRGILA